jgi:hypothetical protein
MDISRIQLTNVFVNIGRVETVLQQKKPSRSSANISNLNARLEYSALPTLEPEALQPSIPDSMETHSAGNSFN